MFNRILIAVDGSEAAGWALDAGIDLARSLSHAACMREQAAAARVGVVHVVDHCDASGLADAGLGDVRPDLPRALRRQGRQILRDARERIPAGLSGPGDGDGAAPGPFLLREGRAADEIVAAARDWHADLIVMGTHGRGRLTPLLVGATVDQTARQAPCPVLVVGRPPRQGRASASRLAPAAVPA
jgi:nucleotide-binding universal stress UspA family protein